MKSNKTVPHGSEMIGEWISTMLLGIGYFLQDGFSCMGNKLNKGKSLCIVGSTSSYVLRFCYTKGSTVMVTSLLESPWVPSWIHSSECNMFANIMCQVSHDTALCWLFLYLHFTLKSTPKRFRTQMSINPRSNPGTHFWASLKICWKSNKLFKII